MVLAIEPREITFLKHPLLSIQLLIEVIIIKLKKFASLALKYWYLIVLGAGLLWAIINLEQLKIVKDVGSFSMYWILLGVASSIGLGTGLHTFVLYLGPHIAKVVVASIDCGYVPEMMPSRWAFSYFKECTGDYSIIQLRQQTSL